MIPYKKFSLTLLFRILVPVFLLARCVPYLELDTSSIVCHYCFCRILHSDGHLPSLQKLVFSISEKDIRLSHSRRPHKNKFEHEIIVLFTAWHFLYV